MSEAVDGMHAGSIVQVFAAMMLLVLGLAGGARAALAGKGRQADRHEGGLKRLRLGQAVPGDAGFGEAPNQVRPTSYDSSTSLRTGAALRASSLAALHPKIRMPTSSGAR